MHQHFIIAGVCHKLQMWIRISQNTEACGPPFEAWGLQSNDKELQSIKRLMYLIVTNFCYQAKLATCFFPVRGVK